MSLRVLESISYSCGAEACRFEWVYFKCEIGAERYRYVGSGHSVFAANLNQALGNALLHLFIHQDFDLLLGGKGVRSYLQHSVVHWALAQPTAWPSVSPRSYRWLCEGYSLLRSRFSALAWI